jgi:hypothetical protein
MEALPIESRLSYKEQSALVIGSRNCSKDPKDIEHARAMLVKFKERRDLFAVIDKEVDGMLKVIASVARRQDRIKFEQGSKGHKTIPYA